MKVAIGGTYDVVVELVTTVWWEQMVAVVSCGWESRIGVRVSSSVRNAGGTLVKVAASPFIKVS